MEKYFSGEEFTDEEMMQVALLENLQREDLSAIEEAKAYTDTEVAKVKADSIFP